MVEETMIVVKLAPINSSSSAMPDIIGWSTMFLEYSVKKSNPALDKACSMSARDWSRANRCRNDCGDSVGFIFDTRS